ncbi:MAG: hypothetical protein AAF614_05280 [Chloroflexota bacterium]
MIEKTTFSTTSTTLQPLWQFVPANDFRRPPLPRREAVRRSFGSAWEHIRHSTGLELGRRRDLRSIPNHLLEWAAPPPSSTQAVISLEMTLQPWLENGGLTNGRSPIQVVLDTPGSGVEQVVKDWARRVGWRIIAPPTVKQILAGGGGWLEDLMRGERMPFVLPRLEKCFLRHYDGLNLINRLLDWLDATNQQCLIACDSWAWAFLEQAAQVEAALAEPWALAPFNGARLQFWLPSLARRTYRGAFVFRRADNGRLIFPRADTDEEEDLRRTIPDSLDYYGEWVNVDYFLKQLAAYSRGMPGVVWAWWRQCLQVSHDVEIDMAVQQEAASDQGYTVWVQPWSQLKLISIPPRWGSDALFILHALLLHGEMSAEAMSQLLPLTDNEIRQSLHNLAKINVVNQIHGLWRVTLLGYPTVRQKLQNEGFLVDQQF